ncbi:MAG: MATE family efflux transporter [Chitinophagales bacterium]|nr:MATE family efflux transporter [Chitinophagales bacterium]
MERKASYSYYVKKIFLVSYPVMIGQAGHMITSTADTIMVGRLGSLELAAVAFANILFMVPFSLAIGFSIGITPLAGKALGEKNDSRLAALLKHGVLINVLLGIILSLGLFITYFYMDSFGQEADEVLLARPFFRIICLSMVPLTIFMSAKQFTEGLGITIPGMVISLVMNLLNVLLNWLLIYGKWGFPELGMNGAAWATLISRIGMAASMVGYIWYSPLKQYLKGVFRLSYHWALFKELLLTGFPIGLQFLLEVGAFIVGAVMVGWISHEALAAHQIAITLCAFTYLMSSGIGTGATIVISNLLGQKQYADVRIAGRASFLMVFCFMAFWAIMFLVFRHQLPLLFNDDPAVLSIAVVLLAIGAFFQLSDGVQAVVIGALRGLEDVNSPMVIAAISYWAITLPCAYILGIQMDMGATGIWIGYLVGLTIAAILLLLRFNFKVRQFKAQ